MNSPPGLKLRLGRTATSPPFCGYPALTFLLSRMLFLSRHLFLGGCFSWRLSSSLALGNPPFNPQKRSVNSL